MFQFFIDSNQIFENHVIITGPDVNHIKNVLRMKAGTEIRISNKQDKDYICKIADLDDDEIKADIIDIDTEGTELRTRVHLFQGIPKGDKMETVIQKTIELGVYEIIPVAMKRCVVKLDKKKEDSKLKRWNTIAESAAKQSKRMIIPKVTQAMSFKEALEYSKDFETRLLPYENAKGIEETRRQLSSIKAGSDVAIFIGPEGGFDEAEIELAKEHSINTVTLGKRILRTETAGLAIMAVIMFLYEE